MEHDFLRSTTLFSGVIQSFNHQVCIRTGGHGPANNPASIEIQHNGQITPPLAAPDIGNVTTPDLVGPVHCKFTSQMVWDIRPFDSGPLEGVRAWLFADQPQFAHLASNLEAANGYAFVAEHVLNRPATSRAEALGKQAVYPSLQGQTLNVNVTPPLAVRHSWND